jgi:hypothetical protein
MKVGECYLINTPPNNKHCFVVSLKVAETQYLLFPITTQRENSDNSCVIQPEDIPLSFVKHASVIGYNHAKEFSEYAICDATEHGYCKSLGSIDSDLLQRILKSALESKRLKNRWKKIIREQIL